MTQQRIEVSLAGHKITLATTSDHEPLLREACAFADEQIQLALASGNKSIERAAMMAAIKLAGELIQAQILRLILNTSFKLNRKSLHLNSK
jgi:cell division protein ZapA